MLFNSAPFWVFYLVVLCIYWRLRHRYQNLFLLAASYYFYGCWNWRFVPLITASTVADYYLGHLTARASGHRKRLAIYVSVVMNLGLLGVFKYYDFFAGEISSFLSKAGHPVDLALLHIILPVGISFYTFQSMSYVIDIYRGVGKASDNLLDFALYVAFFPHLVAGPIMRSGLRASETGGAPGLLKQIVSPRRYRDGDFQEGLYYILLGLFKKIVVGDNLAALVNAIFQTQSSHLNGLECLAGVYAFAFQIYADFSGYSSIAQGVAKWMGFDLMTNFRMPYLATSPSDFWKRWHISLSTWLRDYVYISLGGNKGGRWLTARNLMLTMLLGGIWHGANWTFILWGAYHGVLLCIYRFAGVRERHSIGRKFLQTFVMFHLACAGWLLFRAETVHQAFDMFRAIVTDLHPTALATATLGLVLLYAGPLMLYELWLEYREDIVALVRVTWPLRAAAYSYCVLMLVFFPPEAAHEFIYFQF